MNGLLTENLNYVRLKIKTKKKPTCGYMRFRIITDVYTKPVTGVLARIPGAS